MSLFYLCKTVKDTPVSVRHILGGRDDEVHHLSRWLLIRAMRPVYCTIDFITYSPESMESAARFNVLGVILDFRPRFKIWISFYTPPPHEITIIKYTYRLTQSRLAAASQDTASQIHFQLPLSPRAPPRSRSRY